MKLTTADAVGNPEDTFANYIKLVDKIIEQHFRGYSAMTRDAIEALDLGPLEPCMMYNGILQHIEYLRSQNMVGGPPGAAHRQLVDPDNPQSLTRDLVPWIILSNDDRDDGVTVEDLRSMDSEIHLYVTNDDCSDVNINRFHLRLIRTGERFRSTLQELVTQRRSLTENALAFRTNPGPRCSKLNLQPAELEERKNCFFENNRLEIENNINGIHFRLEALRQTLVRMFDELFARRMGAGWLVNHPFSEFLVYIQHIPLLRTFIVPERPSRSLDKIISGQIFKYNCVTNIDSIDHLPAVMATPSNLTVQIFNFREKEINLVRLIEELTDLFTIWCRTSKFFYYNNWLYYYYTDIENIFSVFKHDFLTNPNSMPYEKKLGVISEFKNLIKNQFQEDQNWYYYGAASLDTLKNFMKSFYNGLYPQHPKFSPIKFHDELK